jgi:hypothetical protein
LRTGAYPEQLVRRAPTYQASYEWKQPKQEPVISWPPESHAGKQCADDNPNYPFNRVNVLYHSPLPELSGPSAHIPIHRTHLLDSRARTRPTRERGLTSHLMQKTDENVLMIDPNVCLSKRISVEQIYSSGERQRFMGEHRPSLDGYAVEY